MATSRKKSFLVQEGGLSSGVKGAPRGSSLAHPPRLHPERAFAGTWWTVVSVRRIDRAAAPLAGERSRPRGRHSPRARKGMSTRPRTGSLQHRLRRDERHDNGRQHTAACRAAKGLRAKGLHGQASCLRERRRPRRTGRRHAVLFRQAPEGTENASDTSSLTRCLETIGRCGYGRDVAYKQPQRRSLRRAATATACAGGSSPPPCAINGFLAAQTGGGRPFPITTESALERDDRKAPRRARLSWTGTRTPCPVMPRVHSRDASAATTVSTCASVMPFQSGRRTRRSDSVSVWRRSPCARQNFCPAGAECSGT